MKRRKDSADTRAGAPVVLGAEPSVCLAVEPANPGHFLACCGLLELADRIWPGSEGWFEAGTYRLATHGTLWQALHALTLDLPTELTTLQNGLEVKPLIAPLRVSLGESARDVILDGWMTTRVDKGVVVAAANPPWNFWSGQQTSLRIWSSLRVALQEQLRTLGEEDVPDLFSRRVPLSGRFGFDPGAAWNALDVGFSPNEQKLEVASSPAVELLAAVGLQRFRPVVSEDRATFEYATWGRPLGPCVAAAAASGQISVSPSVRFLGRVVSRGSYAALGFSNPLKGDRNE